MATAGHGRLQKQQKILQALRDGATRKAAADYAGVARETFYAWLNDETFSDSVRRAEAEPQVDCAASLRAWAKKDWRAALAWLERRYSDEWRERKEVNVRELSTAQLLALATAGDPGVESTGDRTALVAAEPEPLSG